MAIEMLVEQTDNKVPHAYYHDLESVFYSLCWVCTSQEGPNGASRCGCFDFSKAEVSKWNGVGMDNPTLEDIQDRKASTALNKTKFAIRVLADFAPYFAPIKPCITALRKIMVNENSNVDQLAEEDREEIEEAMAKLESARQEGRPVDKTLLAIIPNSERDYRDVFTSIYETIDKAIIGLDEHETLVPCDCQKMGEDGQKLTREEIDKNPKSVRELVDKNAEDKLYRAKAVAEQKKREMNMNGGIAPSGALLHGHSQAGPDIPTDNGGGNGRQRAWGDVPSPMINQRIVASTSELSPLVMTTSRPGNMFFPMTPQQPNSLGSSLLPSPLIKRRSSRTKRSTGSSNMPPPSTPGRANSNHRASNRRTMTPSSLSIHHSPPPSSAWSVSSKRSASEFEDDESGQKTPTQMSPPKKQKLR